jgi:tetratricopeptide (TPR) repeat protein
MDDSLKERWREIMNTDDAPALSVELLKAFLQDCPDHGPAWRRLGRIRADMSRFEEAEQALQTAMDLATPPNLLFVYCDLGTLFRHKGDIGAAEYWFGRAIEKDPDDAQGYILLGGMLARGGRLAEAEQAHRRATACTKGCVDEAHYNLGLVLRAQERYGEAVACFEEALRLDPQYKVARLAKRDVEHAMRLVSAGPPG